MPGTDSRARHQSQLQIVAVNEDRHGVFGLNFHNIEGVKRFTLMRDLFSGDHPPRGAEKMQRGGVAPRSWARSVLQGLASRRQQFRFTISALSIAPEFGHLASVNEIATS